MTKSVFYWLWAFWILYFAIIEGIAVWHEIKGHANDDWTFTHFLATQMPMGLRVAFIAWLAYHFIWVHKNF